MKTNHNTYTGLSIDIITFKTDKKTNKNMNAVPLDKKHNKYQNKFICSICLNQKRVDDSKGAEVNEKKSRSCPVCQSSYSYTDDDSTVTKKTGQSRRNINLDEDKMSQDVQTSQANVTQGLSLLNEVLNVFQSKKQVNNRITKRKTLIFKDIGVSTEERTNYPKPKLSISKIFQYSIEDNTDNGNKFTILTSSQPDTIFESQKCIDLIKHKSSSIPQMKLDELKKSLKEKTKSKDELEEANRMFATVKRVEEKDSFDNRPVVRSGPRVLPVVKTSNFEDSNKMEGHSKSDQTCKHCHENKDYMSSGDSSMKLRCHNNGDERCDDCVYMLCCRHKQNRQRTRELICKRCRTVKQV